MCLLGCPKYTSNKYPYMLRANCTASSMLQCWKRCWHRTVGNIYKVYISQLIPDVIQCIRFKNKTSFCCILVVRNWCVDDSHFLVCKYFPRFSGRLRKHHGHWQEKSLYQLGSKLRNRNSVSTSDLTFNFDSLQLNPLVTKKDFSSFFYWKVKKKIHLGVKKANLKFFLDILVHHEDIRV
jgi:hypothetical protein